MKAIVFFLLLTSCAHSTAEPAAPLRPPLQSSPPTQPPLTQATWGMTELLQAINARRADRGSAPLRVDRGLCAVAERATSEYQRLGRGSEARVLGLLNQDLQGFALSFSRTLAAVVVVEDARTAPELLSTALDPKMLYAGLVVGPAPPPVGPHGGYSVVLTLGE